jgi:mannosyltransferase
MKRALTSSNSPDRFKPGRPDLAKQVPMQPLTRLAHDYKARAIDHEWIRGSNYFWLLVAIAAGFALRVNRLGVQSLWNDEGTSVALARLSLPAIVGGAAHDIHPPLYYLLLHFWIALGGTSEFAIRFLSVMSGVLLVAVTFRLARTFFDQEVAVIAAFLSALSAFQLYYSQETRMYIVIALESALSVWAMSRLLLSAPSIAISAWLAYAVATIAALYTHYFAFTLVLFENLAFLGWLLLDWRSRGEKNEITILSTRPKTGWLWMPGIWVAAQLVVVLAFLPWLAYAGNQLVTWPAISEVMAPFDMAFHVLSAFVFKIDTPLDAESWVVAAYGVFFLVGLLPSLDLLKQSVWGILIAALWTLVPLAAMFAVSLQRPAYDPKFLLLATPGFFILVARGLSILSPGFFLRERARRHSQERSGVVRSAMTWQFLLTFGIVASGALIGARDVYYDPRLQRDDYRGIASYISAMATAKDAVLVDAPGQIEVFRYYYHGPADVKTLPVGRPLDLNATRGVLDDLVARYRNLYAVFWATEQADPGKLVESYLGTHAFKASDVWHGDVRLAEYALPLAFQSGGAQTVRQRFGDEIELIQYDIGAPLEPENAPDRLHVVKSGSILPIDLRWLALKQPSANYKVFVHLLDAGGNIVSQRDSEPVSGFRPTGTWKPGESISDPTGVLIPISTPSGRYTIELGLYRPEDGTRLHLASGGDHFLMDTIRVEN